MRALTEISGFFNRYQALQEDTKAAEFYVLRDTFIPFRDEYLTIKATALEQARLEAPVFNIFNLLGPCSHESVT